MGKQNKNTTFSSYYLDYGELTELLRSRGMDVDDATAIPILCREGYYMVVNGCKDLFLDPDATRDAAGKPRSRFAEVGKGQKVSGLCV